MNLHLGSGTHPSELPGWVDIDLDWGCGPHIVASGFDLPFPDGTFDRVYLGHVLEHLRWEDELLVFLAELRRVAVPGASVMAVGPAIERAISLNQPMWLLQAIVSQAPAPDSSGHQWVATEGLTVRALERGGMVEVRGVDVTEIRKPEWPNVSQALWQCAVASQTPT